ncbi:hypothetical protein [Methylocucumis oryzae]|uniref:Uncharacterized protein n=1 Tax=Methylocucumis oryzae TaxID=1632867 RepID=A0A0F3IHY1_9GAMM|nr:hypothetical protein [Methylocucumis oryzae]KJV05059.1 hypothetical protein VZ94_20930 [Methylocucumis oryzae]
MSNVRPAPVLHDPVLQTVRIISHAIAASFMFTLTVNADQQSKVCNDIRKSLIQRQHDGHEPKDFYIEYREQDGGDSYQGLDIDDDKITDSVVRSCGSGADSLCSLFINFSTGEQLELEEKHFFLARVKSHIYVIVGETSEKEKDKRGKRRVYQITKQAIKLICSHI